MAWNRFLLAVIILLNLFLVYRVLWSDQGIFAYRDMKGRYVELQQRVEELNNKTLELSQEIRLLKSDRPYLENMIRRQMNFLKKNEILYIFPTSPKAPAGAGPDEDQN